MVFFVVFIPPACCDHWRRREDAVRPRDCVTWTTARALRAGAATAPPSSLCLPLAWQTATVLPYDLPPGDVPWTATLCLFAAATACAMPCVPTHWLTCAIPTRAFCASCCLPTLPFNAIRDVTCDLLQTIAGRQATFLTYAGRPAYLPYHTATTTTMGRWLVCHNSC